MNSSRRLCNESRYLLGGLVIFAPADRVRFEMRVEGVNIHAEILRVGAEHVRVCHVLVRPDGPKHDDVRAELQLRMPDELSRVWRREPFDEAEGRAEPSNRRELRCIEGR